MSWEGDLIFITTTGNVCRFLLKGRDISLENWRDWEWGAGSSYEFATIRHRHTSEISPWERHKDDQGARVADLWGEVRRYEAI